MFAYSIVLNTVKSVLAWRGLRLVTVSPSLAGPLVAGSIAAGIAAVLTHTTALGRSLAGGATAAIVLLVVYAVLMLVVGVDDEDKRVLGLALRPTR
jgi:tellurite resistance protein TehA-like permease